MFNYRHIIEIDSKILQLLTANYLRKFQSQNNRS